MPQINEILTQKMTALKRDVTLAQLAGQRPRKIVTLNNDNLIECAKELVSAEKEAMQDFFFNAKGGIFVKLTQSFIDLCVARGLRKKEDQEESCNELIEKNIGNISALLFYLVEEYKEDASAYFTEKHISFLLDGITLLTQYNINEKLLTFLFEKMCVILPIIDVKQLSRYLFSSNGFNQLIERLDRLKNNKQLFGLLLGLLNPIVSKCGDEKNRVFLTKNATLETDILFKVTSILQFIALKPDNTDNITAFIQLLTKITSLFSGNYFYGSYIMRSSENKNCFSTLFSIAKTETEKNNMFFLTYLFETVLNKLDGADQCIKDRALTIFKESKKDYEDALEFYLSQLSPEKLKSILNSEKLITKIIDIKPFFSRKSNLRILVDALHQYHEAGLYSARDKLCDELTLEIKRLQNKINLNDTNLTLSHIFDRINNDLKKNVVLFTASELEISLNADMGQAEEIQLKKNLDTETVALLSKIKMIKSWYVTEYQKEENVFVDELLSIASGSSVEVKKEADDVESKKAAPAAAAKSMALPPIKIIAPVVTQQKLTIVTDFFRTPYALPANIAAIAALPIPTISPAIAALRVPNDPIKQDDIIGELFDNASRCSS